MNVSTALSSSKVRRWEQVVSALEELNLTGDPMGCSPKLKYKLVEDEIFGKVFVRDSNISDCITKVTNVRTTSRKLKFSELKTSPNDGKKLKTKCKTNVRQDRSMLGGKIIMPTNVGKSVSSHEGVSQSMMVKEKIPLYCGKSMSSHEGA